MLTSLFAFMTALFVFGTLEFWVVAAVALIIITLCVAEEVFGFPFVLLLLGGLFLTAANHLHPVDAMWNHPIVAIGVIVAYLAAGVPWAMFKFDRYLKKQVEELHPSFTIFSPHAHKSRITGWMMYWPISFILTMGDELYDILYDIAAKQFEGIAKKWQERAEVLRKKS